MKMTFSEQASQEVTTEKPNQGSKHAKRRNLRYYNVNRDENPKRENEMDCPSLEGFHAQLHWKFTNGYKIKHS